MKQMRSQAFHRVSIHTPVSSACALNPVHLATLNQQKARRILYAAGYVLVHVFGLLSTAGFTYWEGFGVVILWKHAEGNLLRMPVPVYRLLSGVLALGLPLFSWVFYCILLSLLAPMFSGFGRLLNRAHNRNVQ